MPLTRAQRKLANVALPRIELARVELPRIDDPLPCRDEGDGGRKKKKLRVEEVYSDVEEPEDVQEEWQEEGEGGKAGKEADEAEESGEDEECLEDDIEGGKAGKETDEEEERGEDEECLEDDVEGGKAGKETDEEEERGEDEECLEDDVEGGKAGKETDEEEERGEDEECLEDDVEGGKAGKETDEEEERGEDEECLENDVEGGKAGKETDEEEERGEDEECLEDDVEGGKAGKETDEEEERGEDEECLEDDVEGGKAGKETDEEEERGEDEECLEDDVEGGKAGKETDEEEERGEDEECLEDDVEGGKAGKETDEEEERGEDEECLEDDVEGGKAGKETDEEEERGEDEECLEDDVEGGKAGKETDEEEERGEEDHEEYMEEEDEGRKEADYVEEGGEVVRPDSEEQGKKEKVRGKKRRRLSLNRAPRKSRGTRRHHHRQCPLCPMVVFNVPRHLQDIHKKSKEQSLKLSKKVCKMEQHACPVPMCAGKPYTRINRHLVKFHGYKVGSDPYKSYKEKAETSGPVNKPYREVQEFEEVEEDKDEDQDSEQEDIEREVEEELEEEADVGKPPKAVRTLRNFYSFLTGVQGGLKNSKSAQQHCRQFELVWQEVSGRWARRDMMKPTLIQKRWLNVVLHDKKMQPGTILSYISSLKLWVRYTTSRGDQNPKLSTALQGWAQSLKKTLNKRKTQRKEVDLSEVLTPAEVKKVDENCDETMEAKGILESVAAGKPLRLTSNQFHLVSSFLSFQTMVNTGHRSGVLRNMTLGNFRRAKQVRTDSGDIEFIVGVTDHKTSHVGVAYLPLNPTFYRYFSTFIQNIRNPLMEQLGKAPNDEDTVFCHYSSGLTYNSSNFHSMLNRNYHKLIGRSISCKNVRQAVVTSMWEKHPEQRGQLARQLAHSVQTEGAYYTLLEPERVGQLASTVRNILRPNPSSSEGAPSTQSRPTEEEEETQPTSPPSPPPVPNNPVQFVPQRPMGVPQGRRRAFTPEQLAALINIASAHIKRKQPMMSWEMKQALEDASPAERELLKEFQIKQLTDRVRTFVKSSTH